MASSEPCGLVATANEVTTKFKVGDLVSLRSDPQTTGAIIGVVDDGAETRYQVFQSNRQAIYYESQLQLLERTEEPSLLSAEDLRAYLTSLHLLSPSIANL